MEFTDRYKALGIPYPDEKTVCLGDCEGTGRVPIKSDDLADPVYRKLWEEAEREAPAKDGWHFVLCPTCGGSGKRPQENVEDKLDAATIGGPGEIKP